MTVNLVKKRGKKKEFVCHGRKYVVYKTHIVEARTLLILMQLATAL